MITITATSLKKLLKRKFNKISPNEFRGVLREYLHEEGDLTYGIRARIALKTLGIDIDADDIDEYPLDGWYDRQYLVLKNSTHPIFGEFIDIREISLMLTQELHDLFNAEVDIYLRDKQHCEFDELPVRSSHHRPF